MLKVDKLSVGYGDGLVIRGFDLAVADGETVALLGRNGMGKTTLLKALIGMIPSRGGAVSLGNKVLSGRPSYDRVAAGMAFVPQGRMVFPYLTVEENILTGMEHVRGARSVPAYVYDCFPVLKEMRRRRGGNLSGGQQQQLAIARALVSDPKVLLLDEPTEGIQPSINKEIARTLKRLRGERGFSLVVSEQVLSFALEVADRLLVLEKGEVVFETTTAGLDAAGMERIQGYLSLAGEGPAASPAPPSAAAPAPPEAA